MRHLVLSLGLFSIALAASLVSHRAWAEDSPPAEQAAEQAAEQPAPTPAQINEWLDGLDADEFLARERAMNQLIQSGGAAIAPVVSAVESGNPEVTMRGIHVLAELALGENVANSDQAVQALEALAASENGMASSEALEALGQLAAERQAIALQALEQLGAKISRSTIQINFQVYEIIGSIDIGDDWHGEPEDLYQLRWLPDTRVLHISTPQLTDEHLALVGRMRDLQQLHISRTPQITAEGFQALGELQNLRQLVVMYVPVGDEVIDNLLRLRNMQYIRLYGLGFSPEGTDRLKRGFAMASVDIRRGALLGVMCGSTNGACTLTSVNAGSAAAQAGLQPGDVILRINGEDVGDFPGLTEQVSKFAPGETTTFEGTRNGEPFEVEVTFGEWEE